MSASSDKVQDAQYQDVVSKNAAKEMFFSGRPARRLSLCADLNAWSGKVCAVIPPGWGGLLQNRTGFWLLQQLDTCSELESELHAHVTNMAQCFGNT